MIKTKQITFKKTSEEVRESALYVTECCNVEKTFPKGGTFQRCPECERLTEWQLVRLEPVSLKAA